MLFWLYLEKVFIALEAGPSAIDACINNIPRTIKGVIVFIGPMCTWGPIIGSPCHTPFVKPCEDLVKTVNVVNVVKT